MRFTTILVGAFAVLAAAQSTSTTATTATTTAAGNAAASSAQSQMIQCINACQAGDVACTSKCIAVPNPDAAQVNATNNCVADCPKGNGTAADNLNYENCVDGCIGQYYYTTSGTPAATGGSGSGSGSSGAQTTATGSGSPTASGSNSASGTGSAAATSSSHAAGQALRVGGSAAGLFGFAAAILAI